MTTEVLLAQIIAIAVKEGLSMAVILAEAKNQPDVSKEQWDAAIKEIDEFKAAWEAAPGPEG